MSLAIAAVSSVAVGAYTAYQAGEAADDQADLANAANATSAEIAQEELKLAREQWDQYTTNIMPLELESSRLGITAQELALSRGEDDYQMYQDYYRPMQVQLSELAQDGVEGQYDRVSREAANEVDKQFDREAGIQERELSRMGVKPDSGRYKAGLNDISSRNASARAYAKNTATEQERDRVEGVNFNRLATATGRTPAGSAPTQSTNVPGLNPSSISGMFSSAANTSSNVANNNMQAANMYSNNAAGAMQGGIGVAGNLMSLSGAGGYSPGYNLNVPQGGDLFSSSGGHGGTGMASWSAFKHGGLVEPNYADGGMVEGPGGVDNVPATIDGQQPARISAGEFIIPVDVVQQKGTEYFDKLIEKYHAGPNSQTVPANQQAGLPVASLPSAGGY